MDYSDPQTLFDALDTGDCATVKRCLRAGQDLDQPDLESRNLLIRALIYKNTSRVHTLLAFHKHIDLNCVSSQGASVLQFAVLYNQHVASFLIQHGVDVNVRNISQFTAYDRSFHADVSVDDQQTMRLMLLFAGADPTLQETRWKKENIIVQYARKWLRGFQYAQKRF